MEREGEKKALKEKEDDLLGKEYLLPCGYVDDNGVVHKKFRIREMTGADEEAISDSKVMRNGGKIITTLLVRCMEKLGDLEKITDDVVRKMLIGDRDFIMLKIREISLGNEMQAAVICPSCDGRMSLSFDLDKVEVVTANPEDVKEISLNLPVGYKDKDGKVYKDVVLNLPTGKEQEQLSIQSRTNLAAATTQLLTKCIEKLGDLKYVDAGIIRNLTKKDRDYLILEITKVAPGPRFEQEVICADCGHKFVAPLNLADFFISR